jgi:hypothetical protein
MIYTLFIWTVVAASVESHLPAHKHMDWRPLTTVEAKYLTEDNEPTMLAKCENVARQLSIPKDRYRCIRTK